MVLAPKPEPLPCPRKGEPVAFELLTSGWSTGEGRREVKTKILYDLQWSWEMQSFGLGEAESPMKLL